MFYSPDENNKLTINFFPNDLEKKIDSSYSNVNSFYPNRFIRSTRWFAVQLYLPRFSKAKTFEVTRMDEDNQLFSRGKTTLIKWRMRE